VDVAQEGLLQVLAALEAVALQRRVMTTWFAIGATTDGASIPNIWSLDRAGKTCRMIGISLPNGVDYDLL